MNETIIAELKLYVLEHDLNIWNTLLDHCNRINNNTKLILMLALAMMLLLVWMWIQHYQIKKLIKRKVKE